MPTARLGHDRFCDLPFWEADAQLIYPSSLVAGVTSKKKMILLCISTCSNVLCAVNVPDSAQSDVAVISTGNT